MAVGHFCGSRRNVPLPKSEPYLSGKGCDENTLYYCKFQHDVPTPIELCPVEACLQNEKTGEDVCLVPDCRCGAVLGRICGSRSNVTVPGTEPYLSGKGCLENAVYECKTKHGYPILIENCPVEACKENEIVVQDNT
ncbi:unnamed protein product, partial [Oppiella nova]